jgi:preprotein translocase subunit SecE
MATTEKKKRIGPITYARQVRAEGEKVTWTTRQETIQATIMVIIMSIIVALFLFLADMVISAGVKAVTGLG